MFKVIVPKATFKELEKIDTQNQKLIFEKIKALKGKHKGKFRKRAGSYRIVYLKENEILVITLIRIAHRKEVY